MANKYDYLVILQGHYGQHGWEDLCAADDTYRGWLDVRSRLVEYRTNEGGCYRIIRRRVLRTAA